jgi:hypothetical protein
MTWTLSDTTSLSSAKIDKQQNTLEFCTDYFLSNTRQRLYRVRKGTWQSTVVFTVDECPAQRNSTKTTQWAPCRVSVLSVWADT